MIVYKFFTIGEYEKKEKWINNMCSKGYALKGCNICKFYFEPCNPNEYYYSLELLENLPSSTSNEDFLNFLQDEWNIEYVCKYRNWVFFRRKKSQGKFSLFPDISTKICYLKRILRFRFAIVLTLIGFALLDILYPSKDPSDQLFSFLLFIIALIFIIVNIPNLNKYRQLKKSDES